MKQVRIEATLALLGALVCAACGPDFDAYCGDREECLGGNEADVEACIASLDGASDAASDLGCSDEFDAYYECVIEAAECRAEPTGMPCTSNDDCGSLGGSCNGGRCEYKSFAPAEDECDAEDNAWDNCGDW